MRTALPLSVLFLLLASSWTTLGFESNLIHGKTDVFSLMGVARAHRRGLPVQSGAWSPVVPHHKGAARGHSRGGPIIGFPELPYIQAGGEYSVYWADESPSARFRLVNPTTGEPYDSLADVYIDIEVQDMFEYNATSGDAYNSTLIPFLNGTNLTQWTAQVWERSSKRANYPSFSNELSQYGDGNIVILSATLENGAEVEISLGIFPEEEIVSIVAPNLPASFGGEYTYVLDPNNAKFSIYVEKWPFLSSDSALQVTVNLKLTDFFSQFDSVPVDTYRNRYETSNEYFDLNVTSQNISLSDGLVVDEVGPLTFFPTDRCALCGIRLDYQFLYFENFTFYDPDFSILITADVEENASDGDGDGDGGKSGSFDPVYLSALSGILCVVPIAICFMALCACLALIIVPSISAFIASRRYKKHKSLTSQAMQDFGEEPDF